MVYCYDVNVATQYIRDSRRRFLSKMVEMKKSLVYSDGRFGVFHVADTTVEIIPSKYPPVKIFAESERKSTKSAKALEEITDTPLIFLGRLREDE